MLKSFRQKIIGERPVALKDLDQVLMDLDSSVRTHLRLAEFISTETLLVGDDDLMSLNFARFCSVNRLVVLDIDQRILQYIENLAREYGFKIETLFYNVLDSPPRKLLRSFDFFYTNPPYGSKNKGDSCKAFILRGIELCRVGGYGAFVIAASSAGEWAEIARKRTLEFVRESGCKLVEELKNFQKYEDNPIESSMFIIKKIKHVNVNKDFLKRIELY